MGLWQFQSTLATRHTVERTVIDLGNTMPEVKWLEEGPRGSRPVRSSVGYVAACARDDAGRDARGVCGTGRRRGSEMMHKAPPRSHDEEIRALLQSSAGIPDHQRAELDQMVRKMRRSSGRRGRHQRRS